MRALEVCRQDGLSTKVCLIGRRGQRFTSPCVLAGDQEASKKLAKMGQQERQRAASQSAGHNADNKGP
jgi:hypothetical protein